ncbi:hypothetical protein LSAT2_032479, partial [Lamellibrachia satsuma]
MSRNCSLNRSLSNDSVFCRTRFDQCNQNLITDNFLTKSPNYLRNVFWQLSLLLTVALPRIQWLEDDYIRDTWHMTYSVLVNWRQTTINRLNAVVMIEDLIGALKELNLNDVAEIVRLG